MRRASQLFLPPGNEEAATRAQAVTMEAGRCMQQTRPVCGVLIGSVFGLSLSHEAGNRIL